MKSLMSSTSTPCSTPKELSAAVADQSAVLASLGASMLPQFSFAFTAFPCLKVTLGWICSLTSYFSFSPSSSQRKSCLSNWASNSGSVMLLMRVARSSFRSPTQRALPQGQEILPRSMILVSTSLRQVFWTLQVTAPVAGLWLCRVEQIARAQALRVSRSFFSSSVSDVVTALVSWAGTGGGTATIASAASAADCKCTNALAMLPLVCRRNDPLLAQQVTGN